ncbi:MAG: LemA family protein [Verrucomicrobiales bacterium]|nr:LemA family protein [Verrucomicrobiales bacterium]
MDNALVVYIPLLGALLAAACLVAAFRSGKRRCLVENLPTSKTTGVFIGLVELKGTAEAANPLTSYLAETQCVYYQWSIAEHWSRTVIEHYTDEKGNSQTRTRTESGWNTVDNGGELIPFYLQDDCGVILVRPDNAKIEPVTLFNETCGMMDSLYYGKGPAGAVPDSTHQRRFVETGIPLHAALYVMGKAREREDIVAPEITEDKEAPMFLISTRTEDQVRRGFQGSLIGWALFGLILSVVGFVVRDAMWNRNWETQIGTYIFAAIGYVCANALAWIWMVYNALVDLRNRVRQGWSQIDVQLKRRHDLIPNLVNVVKAYRDYEQTLQSELAQLRTQLDATPPGVVGPNFHGVKETVIAIAERYPELKANQQFTSLQKNLIETEERIALARGYFNEIAAHYNTRLEVIPERFVAGLGGMKAQTLMLAEEFERAPVSVAALNESQ